MEIRVCKLCKNAFQEDKMECRRYRGGKLRWYCNHCAANRRRGPRGLRILARRPCWGW